jgi:PiT family inorganic phosphate transporter
MAELSQNARHAIPLIQQYGDDMKPQALKAAAALQQVGPGVTAAADGADRATASQLRGDVYDVLWELRHTEETSGIAVSDKAEAATLRKTMGPPVQYAPIWVRMLSALCLGIGTMVGYKRVVRTLGERLGKQHMTPGQGASAELIGSLLIGTAGFTGLPVSTTHIVTSGIAGTMLAGGQGVQRSMLMRIAAAWIVTLPVTMVISGVLFYVLDNPNF